MNLEALVRKHEEEIAELKRAARYINRAGSINIPSGQVYQIGGTNVGVLTDAQVTDLTDGGQTTLHSHAGSTFWSPDKPPASAGSIDDEFSNSSFTGWTEFDPDSKLTITEGNGGALFSRVTTATNGVNGAYKTLPAGDFSIWTKVGCWATSGTYIYFGLALWQNGADATKKIATWNMYNQDEVIGLEWTDYDTYLGTLISATVIDASWQNGGYLRIRRTGTNYYYDYSATGMAWTNISGTNTLTFTPTHVGLAIDNNNTGVTFNGLAQFFRYVGSDVGVTGIMAGNF